MNSDLMFLTFGLCLIANINAENIQQLGNCKAKLENGKVIDLKPLDNPSNPMSSTTGSTTFKYNPCTDFQCGSEKSAICENSGEINQGLGKNDDAVLTMPDSNLILTYSDGYGNKIDVECICGQVHDFNIDIMSNSFKLTDKYCCAGAPGPHPDNNPSSMRHCC